MGVMSSIPGAAFANAFISEGLCRVIGLVFGWAAIRFRGWYGGKYVGKRTTGRACHKKEEPIMSAEYMRIGIPITNRKPGMVCNEGAKFWGSNVDDYDDKIEYLKFEEGPSPRRSTALRTWPTRWTIWKNTSPTPTA